MGLLDKALVMERRLKKGDIVKPVAESQIVKPSSKIKKEAKSKPRVTKSKSKEIISGLKPAISLSTGKLHLPKPVYEKPDFKGLKERISAKPKLVKLDFSKVKKQIQDKLEKKRKIINPDVERVATGIPGLDEVIEGGLVRNTSILVGGGAGCGKTIFCMQFLVNGVDQYNENGVFITFEENPIELMDDFKRFGWDLEKKIKDKKLAIIHFTPEEVSKFLESGGGIVRDTIESIDAKRVVIDSLTAFTLLFKDELATRKAVLSLFESMAKWNVTTLLTSEQEPDPDKHTSTILEFEVDGVILLYNVRKGDVRERSVEVFKMRATQHSAKIFPMKIEDSGITIFPEETVF
jgi:KaiC/GvpD/RAD55 family RecA-like ATPase